MFDTMTLTKAVGALCGAWLVLLVGGWAADSLYSVGGGGHDDHHMAGYVIHIEEDDGATEEVAEIPFAEFLAAADPADGEGLWRQCRSCHVVEPGVNGTGPSLYGVVGRDIGSADGFGYSSTLAELEGDWTPEMLDGFLESPRAFAPGTAMSFNGFRDVEDRAAMIAYLASFDD